MKKRRCAVKITAALMLSVFMTMLPWSGTRTQAASDTMKIVAIDLRGGNTGEATMISDGTGKSLLVDSGDTNNTGVFDWLDANGYKNRKFDTLVTHWHDDHAGNTAKIIDRYNVGTVYIPSTAYVYAEDTAYFRYERSYAKKIIDAAKRNGTKVVYLKKGQTINVGTVKGKVLYCCGSPRSEASYNVEYINNQSAVIMFSGGGTRLLTAGDLHSVVEKRLVKSGMDLKADIYKMSHHGIDTSNSETFLKAVNPLYAWFTSNTVTPSKYTSALVRESVTRMGTIANVMSTRYNGTITYTCSNGEITVRAERNINKMYQRLIDKKTGKSRKVTYHFNNACGIRQPARFLRTDRYYNRQINENGSVFTGNWTNYAGYTFLKKDGIPALNTVAVKGGKTYWFNIQGRRTEKGFVSAYGRKYYFNPAMATGWKSINGRLYYFMDKKYSGYKAYMEGSMLTGFRTINGLPFYFQDKRCSVYKAADYGKRMIGFFTVSGNTYYAANEKMSGYNAKKRGTIQKGWKTISGRLYYFGDNGIMRKGWQTIGGKRYYMPGGVTAVNKFFTVSGKTYYFNKAGVMQTGIITVSGRKYYMGTDGVMKKGFVTIQKDTYYFSEKDGSMATGFADIKDSRYYFGTDGKLVKGIFTVNGRTYYSDTNGVMQKGMVKTADKTYLFADDFSMVTENGWHEVGGNRYYVKDGEPAAGDDLLIDKKLCRFGPDGIFEKEIPCHLDEEGNLIKGWHEIDGMTYYADDSGELAAGEKEIDGEAYFFDEEEFFLVTEPSQGTETPMGEYIDVEEPEDNTGDSIEDILDDSQEEPGQDDSFEGYEEGDVTDSEDMVDSSDKESTSEQAAPAEEPAVSEETASAVQENTENESTAEGTTLPAQ